MEHWVYELEIQSVIWVKELVYLDNVYEIWLGLQELVESSANLG